MPNGAITRLLAQRAARYESSYTDHTHSRALEVFLVETLKFTFDGAIYGIVLDVLQAVGDTKSISIQVAINERAQTIC